MLDLHDILSKDNIHGSDWRENCEANIYNDLRALDASPLFASLFNFITDPKLNEKNDNFTKNDCKNDTEEILGLDAKNFDVKMLLIGEMLRNDYNREKLAHELKKGNKYAMQFATIVNVIYRFFILTKIILISFWSITKPSDIFDNHLLSEHEYTAREKAREKAIQEINTMVKNFSILNVNEVINKNNNNNSQDHDISSCMSNSKKRKVEQKVINTNSENKTNDDGLTISTIIVDQLCPILFALKYIK
nr:MAG: hypothetical protein [Metapenaeopsis lamellata majanivirus]